MLRRIVSVIPCLRLGRRIATMLAKKTSKNQLTLPKAVVANYPDVDYFDVRDEDGRIVLVPLRRSRADEVRAKLEQLGITEGDVDAAIAWARKER
jgi:bifunctional DNA-binding transcriptional regulator/antitoxin component of YhaV-PrlF toxin-antitoxin module